MNKEVQKSNNILFDIAVVVVSIFSIFPIFQESALLRYLMPVFAIIILRHSSFVLRDSKEIRYFLYLSIVILAFFVSFLLESNLVPYFIHYGMLLIYIPIYLYYKKSGFDKAKRVVFILNILFCISFYQTIQMLNIDAGFARSASKNSEDGAGIDNMSGGYGIVYASLFFVFSNLYLLKSKLFTRLGQIVIIVSLLFGVYFIWRAGFFMALMLLLFGFCIALLKIKRKNVIPSLFFSLLILLFLSVFKNEIVSATVPLVSGTKYEEKYIHIMSEEESPDGVFDTREERYVRDLGLILKYNFIGCWSRNMVGKHSFILDTLAQFGLILGGYFVWAMFFIPYRYFRQSQEKTFKYSITILLILFIYLLFNSFVMSALPAIAVLLPYTHNLLSKSE